MTSKKQIIAQIKILNEALQKQQQQQVKHKHYLHNLLRENGLALSGFLLLGVIAGLAYGRVARPTRFIKHISKFILPRLI